MYHEIPAPYPAMCSAIGLGFPAQSTGMIQPKPDFAGITLGHLLSKHYFSDIAQEIEWSSSCTEDAADVLHRRFATARALAGPQPRQLERTHADSDLRLLRGKVKPAACGYHLSPEWESTNPEPEHLPAVVNKCIFASPSPSSDSDYTSPRA